MFSLTINKTEKEDGYFEMASVDRRSQRRKKNLFIAEKLLEKGYTKIAKSSQ
jgi:hypothetical protein